MNFIYTHALDFIQTFLVGFLGGVLLEAWFIAKCLVTGKEW